MDQWQRDIDRLYEVCDGEELATLDSLAVRAGIRSEYDYETREGGEIIEDRAVRELVEAARSVCNAGSFSSLDRLAEELRPALAPFADLKADPLTAETTWDRPLAEHETEFEADLKGGTS